MDATEMVRIVEEDHVTRNNQRNQQWEANQNARNERYNADMSAIATRNQQAHETINANREGSLNALNDQYNAKQAERQAAYNSELDDMEAARLAAEEEFNNAVNEAANIRAKFEEDKEAEIKRVAKKAQETTVAVAAKETKMSSTGTFNVAAVQSLQGQAPMDRIAKNTEETARYVKKSYEKAAVAVAAK
jgi:hypothetical protein